MDARVQDLLETLLREVRFDREEATLTGIQRLARALEEDETLLLAAPEFLKHDNWKARYLILRAMELCQHPALMDHLPALAQDDSPEIRATAQRLTQAGQGTGDMQAVGELLPLLSHSSWWVRKKAIIGLTNLPQTQTRQALRELAQRDSDDEVRELAQDVLEQWRLQGLA